MISVMSPSSGTIRSMLVTWIVLPSLSVAVAGSFGAVSVATAAAGEPVDDGAARVGEAAGALCGLAPGLRMGTTSSAIAGTFVPVAETTAPLELVLALLPALLLLLLQATRIAASSAAAIGRRARAVGITRTTPAVRMV